MSLQRPGRPFPSDVGSQLAFQQASAAFVDAALHRGGLRFPEIPYRDLIEIEGFGALANDLGIRPVGLPKLGILHVP